MVELEPEMKQKRIHVNQNLNKNCWTCIPNWTETGECESYIPILNKNGWIWTQNGTETNK